MTNTNTDDNPNVPNDSPIPDRLFEGLHYDIEFDAIVGFEIVDPLDEESEIIITDTDGDEVDRVPWEDIYECNYYAIPDEAIDDPVEWYQTFIDLTLAETTLEPTEFGALKYINNHIDVVERKDDHPRVALEHASEYVDELPTSALDGATLSWTDAGGTEHTVTFVNKTDEDNT